MKRVILAGLSAGLILVTTAFAQDHAPSRSRFKDRTLHGTYVLHLNGFDLNDVSMGGHQGEFAAVGLLNFDGSGGASASNLNFAGADSGGDQAVCSPGLSSGSYSVNRDGSGTLTLNFPSTGPTTGTLTFNMVIGNPNGHQARLLLSNSGFSGGGAVTICGEPIATLVLAGGLRSAATEE